MLTLEQTEALVEKHSNMFWDGWNLVIVNPTIDGFTKVSGIFHNGRWSTKRVVEPNSKGLYRVPQRYLHGKRVS